MQNILLINNKDFFDKYSIITLNTKVEYWEVPKKTSILFIGNHHAGKDHIKSDLEYSLKNISLQTAYKYVIIIGKTDDLIDSNTKIPSNVVGIYANNINYDHNKIHFLPMGRDFRSISMFHLSNIENKTRNILCYCNFSVNTHPCRSIIYNNIKEKRYIDFEHMGNFLDYSISRDIFFSKLSQSKFVICPRGNACDTFRFYDALYSGAIPIVVKMNFHNNFEDLPILFLDHEEDYKKLSEDFLNNKYDELSKKIKPYYKELDFNYWLHNICTSLYEIMYF